MKKVRTRVFSILLTSCLVFSFASATAFADDTADTDSTSEEVTSEEDAAEEDSEEVTEEDMQGTSGTCVWSIEDYVLTIEPADGVSGTLDSMTVTDSITSNSAPWREYASYVKTVEIKGDVKTGETAGLFGWMTKVTEINGLENLDVSGATSLKGMFEYTKVTELDLSGWDVSNVTSFYKMFYWCSKLESLNISGWETSSLANTGYMFWACFDLSGELDFSGWDTSNVTTMSGMFYTCSSLEELDLSNFDTSNVKSMDWMFGACSSLQTLNLTGWDTSSATNMNHMFMSCSSLVELDLSGFDMSSIDVANSSSTYFPLAVFFSGRNLQKITLSENYIYAYDEDKYIDTYLPYPVYSLDLEENENNYIKFYGTKKYGYWKSATTGEIFEDVADIVPGDTYIAVWDMAQVCDIEFTDNDAITGDATEPNAYTYTGEAVEPDVNVYIGDADDQFSELLVEGEDYTITYENNTEVGTASVTVEWIGVPDSTYGEVYGSYTEEFAIVSESTDTNEDGAQGTEDGSSDATDSAATDESASDNSAGGDDSAADDTMAEIGTTEGSSATVAETAAAGASKQTITIKKSALKKTVKAKKLTKKNQTFKLKATTSGDGKITYKKIKGNKKIKVSKAGKVTVKKGLKKGKTYKVKVKVTAAKTSTYKKATKTVILKIKVK